MIIELQKKLSSYNKLVAVNQELITAIQSNTFEVKSILNNSINLQKMLESKNCFMISQIYKLIMK